MNELNTETYKFIYITPFLDEVARVKKAISIRTFYEPSTDHGETKLEEIFAPYMHFLRKLTRKPEN